MRDSYGLYMDRLKGTYRETFEKISLYVTAQNFDEDTVETQMSELLDMFLLAQEEEKPVEKIVGDDLEFFCKQFCSPFGWKNKLLNIADRWKNIAWIFFVLGGIDVVFLLMDLLSGEQVDFWSGESVFNITGYLIGIMIVAGIDTIVNLITIRLMFKFKKESFIMKVVKVIQVLTLIVSFLIIFSILQSGYMNLLKSPPLSLCVAGGIYLAVYYNLNKERVQERRASKVSVFGVIREDIELNTDVEFQKEMQKTYQKKRAKLLKRGKPELTWEEFLTLQEQDVQKAYRLKPLYDWFPLLAVVGFGIQEYLSNGFGMELILYVIVLFITEFLILKGIWKIVKGALDTKMTWVQLERRKLEQNI